MEEISHTPLSGGHAPPQTEAHLRLLVETGLLLSSERSLDVIVQAALDAGLQLSGAQLGVIVYNVTATDGVPTQLYKLSIAAPPGRALPPNAARDAFAGLPLPPSAPLFAHTFADAQTLRSADITAHALYASSGLAQLRSHLCSYLAVPIRSRTNEVLGALFYGHPAPNVFAANAETLIATLAAQAAAAIDNARLAEILTREIAVADAARSAQRDTADRLERVFEATTDGVALMDRNWRFTYFNRRANEIVAKGRNLVGLHYLELFPDSAGSVFESRYAEAMNEGHTVEFTDYYAPLDIWAAIRVFPTADGIAIFFQDVTTQRRSERARAAAEQRLRQALDAAQLGTWTWDRESDMLDLDDRAAELYYAQPSTPIARSYLRDHLIPTQDRQIAADNLKASLQTGSLYKAEYRLQRPGHPAQFRWIEATGIPIFREGAADITGMIGVVQDVTDRNTHEVTLRQSEKLAATGRLAATIAHEINNPLEAVTNLIYLAKTDPEVPSHVQRMLETADGELVRVSQIAQQTLGFYRDTTRPVEIDLNELLASVVDLFSRKLIYARLTCSLDLHPKLCIFGLQGEIRQVFSNLLVNAIDASQSGNLTGSRNIIIRARRRHVDGHDGVSVLICDPGSGISANVRDLLFSPFITTKPSLGTGLGLWVTRGIVEKHGGTITFRTSTAPPSGTVFRVFLPLKIANPEVFAMPQSSAIQ